MWVNSKLKLQQLVGLHIVRTLLQGLNCKRLLFIFHIRFRNKLKADWDILDVTYLCRGHNQIVSRLKEQILLTFTVILSHISTRFLDNLLPWISQGHILNRHSQQIYDFRTNYLYNIREGIQLISPNLTPWGTKGSRDWANEVIIHLSRNLRQTSMLTSAC